MTGNPASAADPLDTLFEQQYSDPDVDLYEVFGRVDIGQKGADRPLYCSPAPNPAISTVRTWCTSVRTQPRRCASNRQQQLSVRD